MKNQWERRQSDTYVYWQNGRVGVIRDVKIMRGGGHHEGKSTQKAHRISHTQSARKLLESRSSVGKRSFKIFQVAYPRNKYCGMVYAYTKGGAVREWVKRSGASSTRFYAVEIGAL